MKNILIPVDGSEYSMKAIEAGKIMAKAFDSNIFILSVISPEIQVASGRGGNLYVPMLMDELVERSQSILDESKKQFE